MYCKLETYSGKTYQEIILIVAKCIVNGGQKGKKIVGASGINSSKV